MSALSWTRLAVHYGERDALSLDARQWEGGQLVALLGPNGSGKTSLLRALAGALDGGAKLHAGELRIGGQPATAMSRDARARQLSYLSQTRTGPALVTVEDVVRLGRFAHRDRDPDGRVERVMAELDLAALSSRRFGTLSGGERARVLLGRALAVGAPVLLADEPTAALDPYYALSTLDTLAAQARAGALVVASLHDLSLAERFADRICVLDQGRCVAEGAPQDVLDARVLEAVFRVRRSTGGGFTATG